MVVFVTGYADVLNVPFDDVARLPDESQEEIRKLYMVEAVRSEITYT